MMNYDELWGYTSVYVSATKSRYHLYTHKFNDYRSETNIYLNGTCEHSVQASTPERAEELATEWVETLG